MTPHPRAIILLLAVAILVYTKPVSARSPEDPSTAKALAAEAAALAREGRFDEAAAVYEDAYALDHAPVLLFNLAYVHEKRGDKQAALETYQRYLSVETDPAHRTDAEKRITIINARLDAVPTKEPRATDPVQKRPPKRKDRTVMWALVGTGAALAIAGGIVAAVVLTRGGGGPPTADGVWSLPGGAE